MEQQFRVLGIKGFKGEVEGQHYDSCKVRLEMPVSRNSKNEVGMDVKEAAFGDYSNFEKLREIKFPCVCIVDVEMTTRGLDVFALRPVPGLAEKPKAA
jgi:hypothetical protein